MSAKPRDFLERNVRTRVALIRVLAEGRMSNVDIARRFGATESGIRKFAGRHADEIETVRANLEDEFAGLIYARKAARLAEYEQDIETSNGEIDQALTGRLTAEVVSEDGVTEVMADVSDTVARLLRGKHRALRSIAEELGQLPSRVVVSTDDGAKVRHIVEGVDLGKVMGLGNPNAANE